MNTNPILMAHKMIGGNRIGSDLNQKLRTILIISSVNYSEYMITIELSSPNFKNRNIIIKNKIIKQCITCVIKN